MPRTVGPAVRPGSVARHAQPTLELDDGITLRPWRIEDAAQVVEAYSDPAIQLWHARSMTEDEARAWAEDWARRWREESGVGWAVADGSTVLGQISLRQLNLQDGGGEISYWTAPAARGRGLATRSLQVVTAWAFDQLGLHRIEVNHSIANPASCRVAERAGYLAEGVMRGEALHVDGWHDMHLHARLSTDPPP